jgi:hypothetical protein
MGRFSPGFKHKLASTRQLADENHAILARNHGCDVHPIELTTVIASFPEFSSLEKGKLGNWRFLGVKNRVEKGRSGKLGAQARNRIPADVRRRGGSRYGVSNA